MDTSAGEIKQAETKEDFKIAQLVMSRRFEQREFRANPISWYTERFKQPATDLEWSLHPEYNKHKWDGTPNPFKLMFEYLSKWQSVALESATSTGKTYMLPRVIYWFLDAFPDSLVVTTAPKQSQLKDILWAEMGACFRQFKKIRPRAEMFSLRILPGGVTTRFGGRFNKGFDFEEMEEGEGDLHQALGVVAGVRAGEESATKMQGFHRKYMLFVIEECAGVPQAVLTAIKNTCTGDFNVILAVGNPDSQVDALHMFAELNHVQHIRISAYDHPNIVLGHSLIPGAVTQKSIDIRRDEYGEKSNLYKSRVRGIAPAQAADSLIQRLWILECMVGADEFVDVPDDPDSFNALGVDVANSTAGDMACLAWGRGNELWWMHEFYCVNANHLAHNLVSDSDELAKNKIKNDYHTGNIHTFHITDERIGVDAVGVGVGTVNEFVDTLEMDIVPLQGGADPKGIPVDDQDKPLYAFQSLRAQMYYQARLDLQNHTLRIKLDTRKEEMQLVRELTIVTYKVSDKIIVIEPKEKIKEKMGGKSPNMADAFVYWNWVRKDHDVGAWEMPVLPAEGTPPYDRDSGAPAEPDLSLPIG